MALRAPLVALIVVATGAFVVGVALERSSKDSHHKDASRAAPAESSGSGAAHAEEGGNGEPAHAEAGGESAHASGEASGGESDATLLGIDLESTPLLILVALASLTLAAAVWVRPRLGLLLGATAVAMVVFAVLDVREVTHQLDEDRGGLPLLAGVVAGLHLAAAAVAAAAAKAAPGGAAGRTS